jgi:hypothetical protein
MMNAGVPGWGSPASLIPGGTSVTPGLGGDRPAAQGSEDEDGEEAWTPAERALLEAALEFYGAAEGVIDYAGRARPQLRRDAAGFDAVRRAMAALEARVVAAHDAGLSAERIAEVARIEPDMVALILRRRDAAPRPAEG